MQALICGAMLRDFNYLKKIYNSYDITIAVDKGAECFERANILPDRAIGDFDSIDQHLLLKLIDSNVDVKKFQIDKDMSDLELAIDTVKNYDRIDFTGVLGGKFSHEIFNINIISKLKKYGYKVSIREPKTRIEFISDGDVLKIPKGLRVSFVPINNKQSYIWTKGFKWNLNKTLLDKYSSLTLSNETLEISYVKVRGDVVMAIIEPLEIKTRQEKKSF